MPLTNIQILRSAVPYKRPDVTFLLDGQLALNYKDEEPGLFAKLQNGDLIKFGPTAITTNGDAPNSNPDPTGVAGNLLAEKWYDARPAFDSGIEKIWDGLQWNTTSGFTVDDATGNMSLDRQLSVDTLDANQLNLGGGIDAQGDITPGGTDCVYSVGLAGERWSNAFFCELDVQGDGQIGNDLQVLNDLAVNGLANVTGNLFVSGQQATFGQNCASGNFTVETPTFLNCDTQILGNVTAGSDVDVAGDLTVLGTTIQIGQGCGVSTLTVEADTIFNCPITFADNNFTFGDGCATSVVNFDGATTFNCDLFPGAASAINIGSTALPYDEVHADFFYGGAFEGTELDLSAKATSDSTVAGDDPATLTTKDYVDAEIIAATTGAAIWTTNATTARTVTANLHVVPNGTADLGRNGNRWRTVFGNTGDFDTQVDTPTVNTTTVNATTLNATSMALTGKATSASTLDSDAGSTLVTKDFVDSNILWEQTGTDVSLITNNLRLLPNGTSNLGSNASPWNTVVATSYSGTSYSGTTLTLTGKGTSASTAASDAGTTLVTKDYVDSEVTAINYWQRGASGVAPLFANDNIVPTGTADIGQSGDRWDNVFANSLDSASLTLSGKGTSASTVAGDAATTLVTKDYVDSVAGTVVQRTAPDISPITANDNFVPNGTANIGEDANRWTNGYFNDVFTNDLHLKNDRGDWTMIEEEDVLTLRNNKTGKRYAIMMTPYKG